MNNEVAYICTVCKKLLLNKDKFLHCENCNLRWPIIDGIPQFTDDYLYWGEIPQNMMQQINGLVQKRYWKDVLKQKLTSQKQKETYEFIVNLTRANWHFFLPLSKEANVLDVGSGLGTISQSLSYYCQRVVAMETVPERLFFSKVRFMQEKIQNIQLVRANVMDLPFPDDYFDLVIMNGVLEWVGLSDCKIEPRELQLIALKNIQRVLKKAGYLYIGIENRYGYNFFLGRIDHSYLRYTSVLPRRIADIYSRLKKNQGYRTYTYSYSGYRKLLNQAGFKSIKFFCPVPHYNNPDIIFKLKKSSLNHFIDQFIVSKYFKKRIIRFLVKTLSSLDLVKYIVGDYIIFTQKDEATQENRIINYIKNNSKKLKLNEKHLKDLCLFGYNYSSVICFILFNENQPLFHIKLRRKAEIDNTLKQEYENLKNIKNKIDVDLKSSIPTFIILDQVDEFQILFQNVLPGNRLDGLLKAFKHPHLEKERNFLFTNLELVKNFLIKFHRSVQNGYFNFTDEELEFKVTNLLKQFFNNVSKNTDKYEINKIVKQAKILSQISIRQIPQHGDFCDCNILIAKNHVFVIDWESYTLTDLPLFDIFHILTTSIISFLRVKEINPCYIFKRIYFEHSELTNFINYFLEDYCKKLNIPKEFIKLCFPLYLIAFYNNFSSNPAKEKTIENYSHYIQFYFKYQDKLIFT